jgi:hypothetical protein
LKRGTQPTRSEHEAGPYAQAYCRPRFAGTLGACQCTLWAGRSEREYMTESCLREAFLACFVVNPTGEKGGFVLGDIYQEGLNRGIEPIIQHKDTDFGSYHV